jgi:hypothetical protein
MRYLGYRMSMLRTAEIELRHRDEVLGAAEMRYELLG